MPDQVLSWLSFGDTSIRTKLSSQARILAFFYVVSACYTLMTVPVVCRYDGKSFEGSPTSKQKDLLK